MSTNKDTDEALRERLRAFAENAESTETEEHVYELTIKDLATLVKSELSRAGGERAGIPSGAPITNEEFTRELSAEYLAWSEDPRDNDISGPLEEIQRLCEVIVGLRRQIAAVEADWNRAKHGHRGTCAELERTRGEVSRLRRELAEVEVARAKAMEGAAPDLAEAEKFARQWMHFDGQSNVAVMAEYDRRATVIAAQAAELERLRSFKEEVRQAHLHGKYNSDVVDAIGDALHELDRAPVPPVPQAEPQPSGEGKPPCR